MFKRQQLPAQIHFLLLVSRTKGERSRHQRILTKQYAVIPQNKISGIFEKEVGQKFGEWFNVVDRINNLKSVSLFLQC